MQFWFRNLALGQRKCWMSRQARKKYSNWFLVLNDIQQQTEHLLHEYELDDKTLQKAQLEQHEIFQNFLTSPAPAAPNAPPLLTGATPKVCPLLEPNESYTNFLARLETAISHTVIREETKTARDITCLWECKSGMSESYHCNSWDWDYYWLFEGLSQSRIRNSKDANASWNNGYYL